MSVGLGKVMLRGRRLYMPAAVHETYFAGAYSVILLRKEKDLLLLPVRHAASGGYVLKIRNAAGDRVIDAGDFFRDHGLADNVRWEGAYGWRESSAGLRIYEVFLM